MSIGLKNILINAYKEEMIAYMHANPEEFEEAIQLAVSDEPRYSWRAAWLLWSCMSENDERIQRHIKQIVNAVVKKPDNHQRELMKILLNMDLNEEHEGRLFDLSMTIWESLNKKPSVRVTAFKFILKISQKHPDLLDEIEFITQDHYLETLSPGIKMSVSRMIKENLKIYK